MEFVSSKLFTRYKGSGPISLQRMAAEPYAAVHQSVSHYLSYSRCHCRALSELCTNSCKLIVIRLQNTMAKSTAEKFVGDRPFTTVCLQSHCEVRSSVKIICSTLIFYLFTAVFVRCYCNRNKLLKLSCVCLLFTNF